MTRVARKKGEFCVYHLIQRGNERKSIFLDDDDRRRFLETLTRTKGKYGFALYCYCLMENHVHLLLADQGSDISQVMKSLNVSYAMYFNRRYRRTGHLFQDRFKSMLVMDDTYLVEASRYIHNNPVQAGIVERPYQYQWSSCAVYAGVSMDGTEFLDTSSILRQFSSNQKAAMKYYLEYVTGDRAEGDIKFMAPFDERDEFASLIRDRKGALETLERFAAGRNASLAEVLPRGSQEQGLRAAAMRMLRKNSTLTLKEIGEIFGGITESAVSRAVK